MSSKKRNVSKKDLLAVHNDFVHDERLSFDEIGLLAFMLSCPNGFDFSAAKVAKSRGIDIIEVNGILSSLKNHGYYRQIKLVDRHGNFVDWAYEVSDEVRPEWIGISPIELA